jgi:hypothetical protein
MARYTSAYISFLARISEVDVLIKFAREKEKSDPFNSAAEINALCRGAIVLLSSHLEAFIKELGDLALTALHEKKISRQKLAPRIFYHISKQYFDELKGTSDPDKLAEKLFAFISNDLSYWAQSGYFPDPIPIELFNKGFSNPAFKKICSYFNRFGFEDYQKHLARKLKANFQTTITMVDHLVDVRNKIAHGDQSATKTPLDVKAMSAFICNYSRITDDVFAAWWKGNFCSIR